MKLAQNDYSLDIFIYNNNMEELRINIVRIQLCIYTTAFYSYIICVLVIIKGIKYAKENYTFQCDRPNYLEAPNVTIHFQRCSAQHSSFMVEIAS